MTLPTDHQTFFDRMLPIVRNDHRFLGIAAAGSWITNTMDIYSDLDFVIVVDDAHYEQVMQNRQQIAKSFGNLLTGFTGEHVGEPRVLICLYNEPLLHVDLKFVSHKDVSDRIENPVILWEREETITKAFLTANPVPPVPDLQWIEDRFWVWVHYGALRLGRGELFEVIGFLGYLRVAVLGPLSLMLHQNLPRGVRRLETLAPSHLEEMKKTVPAYDRKACADSIRSAIKLYRILRDAHAEPSLILREDAEVAAVRYFEQIAAQ